MASSIYALEGFVLAVVQELVFWVQVHDCVWGVVQEPSSLL